MNSDEKTGKPASIERSRDRWVSIVLSVVLHGSLVALLAYGWLLFRHSRPPTPTLAIEATVVDARALRGKLEPPPPQPAEPESVPPESSVAPPPPESQSEPEGPPEPTPDELQKRAAAAAAAERERQQAAEERKAAEQRRAEQERRAQEERQTKERAAAERRAREDAEAKKRADELKRQAARRAEETQRQAEASVRAEQEADLKRSLAAEEHVAAARSSAAAAEWASLIADRIKRNWNRPASALPGIQCVVYITQAPGGTIINVRLGSCNGDGAVKESIVAAAYRASPLPPPSDPAIFQRDLEITFKPE